MLNSLFNGNNHSDYERWVLDNRGSLSRLDLAHRNAIKEADSLCKACQAQPDSIMLCSGTRRVFLECDSDAIGKPVIVMHSCPKTEAVIASSALDARFNNSLLFKPVIEFLKEQRAKDDGRVCLPVSYESSKFKIGDFELPVCSWIEDDPGQYNREVLVDYVAAMVFAGYKAVYMRSNDFYNACFHRYKSDQTVSPLYRDLHYAEDIFECMIESDWLVLVNLHGQCPISRCKAVLFEAVQSRFDAGKPTTLVLNEPFNVDNEEERILMELVKSWTKLKL